MTYPTTNYHFLYIYGNSISKVTLVEKVVQTREVQSFTNCSLVLISLCENFIIKATLFGKVVQTYQRREVQSFTSYSLVSMYIQGLHGKLYFFNYLGQIEIYVAK